MAEHLRETFKSQNQRYSGAHIQILFGGGVAMLWTENFVGPTPGVGTSLSSHTGMCASFGVVFGTKILGMGYAFCRNFLGLGLIFTRNSGNGQV